MTLGADDPIAKKRVVAFVDRLRELGWKEGVNLQTIFRWNAQDPDRRRQGIAELVALAPDVTLATGSTTVGPLLKASRSLPIVFVIVPDPVAAGFVRSLARPGGNATGFLQFEHLLSTKWLEFLREIVPSIKRVGVLLNPSEPTGMAQLAVIQDAAALLRIEVVQLNAGNAYEIRSAISSFAGVADSGLIVTSSPTVAVSRLLVIELAERFKLPAIYYERYLVESGGLISYGPDFIDQYRRGAEYVDRILRGEKPADLPVQAPTKYELVINQKAAKALGLTIPPAVLLRADDVLE